MARILPWMILGSTVTLLGAALWSFYEHVYFEETLFSVLTAVWG